MSQKKLFIRIASLIVFISLTNLVATKFFWYSSIWYFDMFMHFIGGFWVGLFVLWLLFNKNFKKEDFNISFVLKVVFLVLFVGILWELFEIFVDKTISKNLFNILDTLSDLCFDTAGGFASLFYFFRKIMLIKKNEV